MIIKQENNPVYTSGTQAEAHFGIDQKNIAFILQTLRNNLYSNKILAVVREYCANAYDAHVDNGKADVPFEVTLPTSLSNIFTVRDFGKGLTQDEIFNVFASYGNSTKRNTNEQIGGFGIGSKSAFCYVNNFSIISWCNGVKTTYEAYIDETNIGKVTQIGDPEISDEPSGIAISVSVKNSDIHEFAYTSLSALCHYKVKPVIKGNTQIAESLENYSHPDFVFQCPNGDWVLYNDYYNETDRIGCIMGNVYYPINASLLGYDQREWLYSIGRRQLLLNAPLGSMNVAASREALEYDEPTKEYINNAVTKAMQEVKDYFEKALASAENLWSARMMLREMHNSIGNIAVSYVWNGNDISIGLSSAPFEIDGIAGVRQYGKNRNDNPYWSQYWNIPFCSDNVVFFVECLETSSRNYAKARMAQYIGPKKVSSNTYFWIQFNTQEAYDEFVNHEEIVGANIVNVLDIPYTPTPRAKRVKSGADGKKTCKAFTFNRSSYQSVKSEYWDSIDVDAEGGSGIYVMIHGFQPNNHYMTNDTLNKIIYKVQALTGQEIVIHGFRSSTKNIGSKWVKLEDYIQKVIKKGLKNKDLQKVVDERHCRDHYLCSNTAIARSYKEHKYLDGSLMGEYVKTINGLVDVSSDDKLREKYNAIIDLNAYIGSVVNIDLKPSDVVQNLQAMAQKINVEYPLLDAIRMMRYDTRERHYFDYIDLVDKVKSLGLS